MPILRDIVLGKSSRSLYAGTDRTINITCYDNDGDVRDVSGLGWAPKMWFHSWEGSFIGAVAYDSGNSTLASGLLKFNVDSTVIATTAYQFDAVMTVTTAADIDSSEILVTRIDILQRSLATS